MAMRKPRMLLAAAVVIGLTVAMGTWLSQSLHKGAAGILPVSDRLEDQPPPVSRLDLAYGGALTIYYSGDEQQPVLLESPHSIASNAATTENRDPCLAPINLETTHANSCLKLVFDLPGENDQGFERDYASFIAGPPGTHDAISALTLHKGGAISITSFDGERVPEIIMKTILGPSGRVEHAAHASSKMSACATLNVPKPYFDTCLTITFATPADNDAHNRRRITELAYLEADLRGYRQALQRDAAKTHAPQQARARELEFTIDQYGIAALEREYGLAVMNVDIRPEASVAMVQTFFARNGLIVKHLEDRWERYKRSESEFRRARILVSHATIPRWRAELLQYWFIADVAEDQSDYRSVCERYGGLVRYSGRTGETCVDLPLPEIDWQDVDSDWYEQCDRDQGTWTTYTSTCTGGCSFDRNEVCGTAMTEACNCAPGQCLVGKKTWDGTVKVTCIQTPEWQLKSGRSQ